MSAKRGVYAGVDREIIDAFRFATIDEIRNNRDMILLDDRLDLEVVDDMEDVTVIPEEHVLIDEPDWVMREQYGINDYFKDKERQYELRKCRDDQVVD